MEGWNHEFSCFRESTLGVLFDRFIMLYLIYQKPTEADEDNWQMISWSIGVICQVMWIIQSLCISKRAECWNEWNGYSCVLVVVCQYIQFLQKLVPGDFIESPHTIGALLRSDCRTASYCLMNALSSVLNEQTHSRCGLAECCPSVHFGNHCDPLSLHYI